MDNNIEVELFKATLNAGTNSLKMTFLMNGGASLALLAFIGNLADKNSKIIADLGCSLLWFAIGTLLVVVASGFVYIVQVLYQNNQSIKSVNRGKKLNIVVVIIIFISYLSFFMGIYSTYKTFATVLQ